MIHSAADPASIPLGETLRFLERVLPRPPLRLLEAGAGDGALAAELASRGYDVTALDEAGEPEERRGGERPLVNAPVRWVEADFLHYDEEEPYDVVLFTRSLHHMTPVAGALDRARALLRPGGLMLAEEFAYDRVNLPTAQWYYDLESVLVAAAVLEADPSPAPGSEEGSPLGRWRRDHTEDPPLQTGHAMLAAARERFDLGPVEETAYLYRTFCARLEPSERGTRVARRILELESRLVRERDLTAAGLRIVGKRTD